VRDRWAKWLLERRFGGDAAQRDRFLGEVALVRDQLLDNAGPLDGLTLLDVGCGDGLIAFGALERGAEHVIFSDISQDLLDEARRIAEELAVADRCSFVRAPAEDLAAVESASADVLTTRSVLIYVKNKARAFAEFARVLRTGGRLSLFEPINGYFPVDRDRLVFYDAAAFRPLVDRIRAVYERIQPPGEDPMLDFDERDLIRLAERAGFCELHLRLHADVETTEPRSWASFVNTPGNPRIPTLAEAMDEILTPEERARVTEHLRPLVEEGRGVSRLATAYLRAVKPSG
jgi:arsenite methyltransferase